jgi:hypothetical protein
MASNISRAATLNWNLEELSNGLTDIARQVPVQYRLSSSFASVSYTQEPNEITIVLTKEFKKRSKNSVGKVSLLTRTPLNIKFHILAFLNGRNLQAMACVDWRFNGLVKDISFWKITTYRTFGKNIADCARQLNNSWEQAYSGLISIIPVNYRVAIWASTWASADFGSKKPILKGIK